MSNPSDHPETGPSCAFQGYADRAERTVRQPASTWLREAEECL